MKRLGILTMVLAVALCATAAWADFYVVASGGVVGTRITSLPYTISQSGFYFLAKDLKTTGSGITVNVDNVTIDLMGFTMAGNDTAGNHGIIISGRSNVEIRNGTVRDFDCGIYSIVTSQNCRIINIRALSNQATGIKLVGYNHLVRNCHASNNSENGIWQSGHGTMITGNVCNGNGTIGIYCTSGGNLIDNVVYGNTGYGFNLTLLASEYYVFDRNTVYSNTGGNLNGVPVSATFGVNAGIP